MLSSQGSPYDPHVPDQAAAAWFEGWGHAAWNNSLVTAFYQPQNARQPVIQSLQNLQLNVSTRGGGGAVLADPEVQTPPNFTIRDPAGQLDWRIEGDNCSIAAVLGSMRVQIECIGPPKNWGPAGRGPEGLAAGVPTWLTGLHWFVYSVGTPVRYTIAEDGKAPITGLGLAHMEKNWGLGFPDGWLWAQGLNATSSSSNSSSPALQAAFTVAGGQIPSPLVPGGWLPDAWLLGVRTVNHSWDFHLYDSIFTAQSDPCSTKLLPNSTFNITALQPLSRREVRIEISAATDSFEPVDCPTKLGFMPFSVESFTATATVRLFEWEFNPSGEKEWLQKRIVEAFTLHNVALEYGGDRRCGQQAQHGQQHDVTQGGDMGQPSSSRWIAGLLQSMTGGNGVVADEDQ
ncbi:hypothetical protein N2152v2_010408 [Parachlorella kessleri]